MSNLRHFCFRFFLSAETKRAIARTRIEHVCTVISLFAHTRRRFSRLYVLKNSLRVENGIQIFILRGRDRERLVRRNRPAILA